MDYQPESTLDGIPSRITCSGYSVPWYPESPIHSPIPFPRRRGSRCRQGCIHSIAATLPFFNRVPFVSLFFVCPFKKGIFGKKGSSRRCIFDRFFSKRAYKRFISDRFLPKLPFDRHLAGILDRFTPLFLTYHILPENCHGASKLRKNVQLHFEI